MKISALLILFCAAVGWAEDLTTMTTMWAPPFIVSYSTPTMMFNDKDKTVGVLSWMDGHFKFEGEADQSAKIFFDYLNRELRNHPCE